MIPGHPLPAELILDDPTQRLCAAITSGALSPVRLAVIAPGGWGKSALLDLLATAPDARAHRPGRELTGLLLVDDAHLAGEADLRALTEAAADPGVGLVVAARPRPRPAALTALLSRLRGQVVLRPFDRDRTARCLAATAGRGLPDAVISLALRHTAGIPGLVHRLAPHLGADTEAIPASAIEDFRFDVDRLDPDVTAVLIALEAGVGGDLLGCLVAEPAETVERARASGMVGPDGSVPPLVATALRDLVPADQRAAVLSALADERLRRGGAMVEFADALLRAGSSGGSAAAVYAAAAEQADPAHAVRLHEAAADAGHPVDEVRRAEAEALSGALDSALRRADAVLATDCPRRGAAAAVAAAVLAHRGQLARSAELHDYAGSGAFAAIGLLGVGRLADAEKALRHSGSGEPTTLMAGAISSAAAGILSSVKGADPAALSTVVRAAEMLEPLGPQSLLPDSPAALGALLALHTGAAPIAESLLDRAAAAGIGGAVLTTRHRLLRSWSAMLRGEGTAPGIGADLSQRDWLFAVALAVGAARRDSDLAALREIWEQAQEAVVRHPVDLYALLPLGEFAVAAARLGDRERFAPHLSQAWALLSDLGDPPAWSAMLHWNCLHAEIIAEQPTAAQSHADALSAAAATSPFHATLAEAAHCWRRVLEGAVDADRVEAAARGLHAAGLWWDGARLAGQAAIRTSDRKAMVALLDRARVLQSAPTPDETRAGARLSDRELQVAALVVEGLTYKQIGDRLFISAKTVEHHMARMRSRLGATSRADLLAQLRTMVTR
ncbi:helix-turn-helix transcriptional regulator [Actinokineospora pegani]|uniref:helix-turn-helix transcriptional regulator n=1 Tax=Actinokineospora pegani TaxID=2654637 RepID=UPI0012EA9D29|nr:helix-turn-helix transcriptional regulator [Actinokineospora pegani]